MDKCSRRSGGQKSPPAHTPTRTYVHSQENLISQNPTATRTPCRHFFFQNICPFRGNGGENAVPGVPGKGVAVEVRCVYKVALCSRRSQTQSQYAGRPGRVQQITVGKRDEGLRPAADKRTRERTWDGAPRAPAAPVPSDLDRAPAIQVYSSFLTPGQFSQRSWRTLDLVGTSVCDRAGRWGGPGECEC